MLDHFIQVVDLAWDVREMAPDMRHATATPEPHYCSIIVTLIHSAAIQYLVQSVYRVWLNEYQVPGTAVGALTVYLILFLPQYHQEQVHLNGLKYFVVLLIRDLVVKHNQKIPVLGLGE